MSRPEKPLVGYHSRGRRSNIDRNRRRRPMRFARKAQTEVTVSYFPPPRPREHAGRSLIGRRRKRTVVFGKSPDRIKRSDGTLPRALRCANAHRVPVRFAVTVVVRHATIRLG